MKKAKVYSISLQPKDKVIFEELAARHSTSVSGLVRMAVKFFANNYPEMSATTVSATGTINTDRRGIDQDPKAAMFWEAVRDKVPIIEYEFVLNNGVPQTKTKGCPFCGKSHLHGQHAIPGFRRSHCKDASIRRTYLLMNT